MRTYIEAGKIVNIHGIKGVLKVESWCDSPSVLKNMKRLYLKPCKSGDDFKELTVEKASVLGDSVLLKFDGIDTPKDAEKLRGTVIYAHRDDIPLKDGAVLIDDMKGLPVIDARSGRKYGRLSDVVEIGGRELYEIECGGKKVFLPSVRDFISSIDTESGIYITPIEGFFDED